MQRHATFKNKKTFTVHVAPSGLGEAHVLTIEVKYGTFKKMKVYGVDLGFWLFHATSRPLLILSSHPLLGHSSLSLSDILSLL